MKNLINELLASGQITQSVADQLLDKLPKTSTKDYNFDGYVVGQEIEFRTHKKSHPSCQEIPGKILAIADKIVIQSVSGTIYTLSASTFITERIVK